MTIAAPVLAILCGLAFFSAGCATPQDIPAKKFSEILDRYPPSGEQLRIKKLTALSAQDIDPAKHGRAVTVIVHPAYSLFFREERRSRYTEAKYDLLKFQLDSEARFISAIAKTDSILVLLLPGNFENESIAPLSYITYLNSTAGGGQSVYYINSEIWSSGALSTDSIVTLYAFLHQVKADKVLIGGGFIGRCQREFYNQTATYLEKISAYIVPEISSISPDDISTPEASEILESLRRRDYALIKRFIERKTQGAAGILQLPGAPAL